VKATADQPLLPPLSNVGKRIRQLREALGLRLTDVAGLADLSISGLSNIETGQSMPSLPTLIRIGRALKRPPSYFLLEEAELPKSLGIVSDASSPEGLAASHFAQLLAQKTSGQLTIQVFAQSELGSPSDQAQGLAAGAIDMVIQSLLYFDIYAPVCGLAFLPFCFETTAAQDAFFHSEYFQKEVHDRLLAEKIRLLNPSWNWGSGPYMAIASRSPVFVPEDLVGKRVRSYNYGTALRFRELLGAVPVPVQWQHVAEAFQRGDIEVIFAYPTHFFAWKVFEYAKYITVIDGCTPPRAVAINDVVYQRLLPDTQRILIEATDGAGDYVTGLVDEEARSGLSDLMAQHGSAIIQTDPVSWRESFRRAVRQVILEAQDGTALLHQIEQCEAAVNRPPGTEGVSSQPGSPEK
jgi:TRAP-type C4-dicarboxylate transport system substrate-binding protein